MSTVLPSDPVSTIGEHVRSIGAARPSITGGVALALLSSLLIPSLVTVTGTVLYGIVFTCVLHVLLSLLARVVRAETRLTPVRFGGQRAVS